MNCLGNKTPGRFQAYSIDSDSLQFFYGFMLLKVKIRRISSHTCPFFQAVEDLYIFLWQYKVKQLCISHNPCLTDTFRNDDNTSSQIPAQQQKLRNSIKTPAPPSRKFTSRIQA